MSKLYSNFLFSFVVAVVMNALDMVYHLATGWAVHLNYVAIKLTVIFLTVWMITQFIGLGKEEGIVASIFGPVMFYVYYVFAGATLNREIFKLDEQFWFIFLHIAFMLIAYFTAWYFAKGEKQLLRTISFVLIASATSVAFYVLFIMIRWRMMGVSEDDAATLMTFKLVIIPAIAFIIGISAGVVLEKFTKKRFTDSIAAGLISEAIILLLLLDFILGFIALIIVLVSYYIIHTYKKNLVEA
ncbi:hypothetical protein HYX04_02385 [Candidatus Woesearchaeota archaeon]|nr:hypothetical protein [Candidatus Woesearchaeota archaeon]